MHSYIPLLTATALLVPLAAAAGLYPKSSSVLNVDGKNFDKLIKKSDKVSASMFTIVEFYAPWCGHCQNLKPAYEKAAKSLDGLANVAAVNCDDDENKAFCGKMGIQGFPTLKTVRIGKNGKPIIQEYQGQRTASGIVEAVASLVPNTVSKVTDDKIASFFSENNSTAKALVFSNKGTTSTLMKVLSNEYGDNMIFGQVRDKEKATNQMFGVTEYPTVIILPGGDRSPVQYSGKIDKKSLNMFLSSYADTWSYPKVEDKKKDSKDNKRAESSASSKFAKSSASQASSEASAATGGLEFEWVDLTESPDPIAHEDAPTPVPIPVDVPTIDTLDTYEQVQGLCLGAKTHTCVLALLPGAANSEAEQPQNNADALASLSKIARKHKDRGDRLFPFYAIPESNPGYATLKTAFGFDANEAQLYAVNGKRNWYKQHDFEKGFGLESVEDWIDGIRFGEGKKEKLPEGLVVEVPSTEEPVPEPSAAEEPEPAAESGAEEVVVEEIVEVVEVVEEEPPKPREHNEL